MQSLEILSAEVQAEREAQARHFDGLDSKAGVALGFAGVLVALSTASGTSFGALAALVALLAAVFAFSAYAPRAYPVLDVRTICDRYLNSAEGFTRLHLLDTKIDMIQELAEILREKALRLRIGLVLLAMSGALLLWGYLATLAKEVKP